MNYTLLPVGCAPMSLLYEFLCVFVYTVVEKKKNSDERVVLLEEAQKPVPNCAYGAPVARTVNGYPTHVVRTSLPTVATVPAKAPRRGKHFFNGSVFFVMRKLPWESRHLL